MTRTALLARLADEVEAALVCWLDGSLAEADQHLTRACEVRADLGLDPCPWWAPTAFTPTRCIEETRA